MKRSQRSKESWSKITVSLLMLLTDTLCPEEQRNIRKINLTQGAQTFAFSSDVLITEALVMFLPSGFIS